jgi:predicted Rossmann fold nucleotide-binding protein DprA/Smf involved in DNA uptake
MNWEGKSLPKQQSIDFVYDEVEKVLIDLIDFSPTIHIDTLHMKSGIPFTTLQGTLLQLELKDAICKLPGNRWAIHRKNVS